MNVKSKKCKINTETITMLGIANRMMRSAVFNIVVFFIGLCCGIGTLEYMHHKIWKTTDEYKCIDTLVEHLEEQRVLDKKIDKEIKTIKTIAIHNKLHVKNEKTSL